MSDAEKTTSVSNTRDLLLAYLDNNHPRCPGCQHQLSSDTTCPECGRPISLAIHWGRGLSIPWLFAFVPWLFLASTGVLSWVTYTSLLLRGQLGTILSVQFNQKSPSGDMIFIGIELVMLASPFLVAFLWINQEQVRNWKSSSVFLVGIIPLIAFLFTLLASARLMLA